MSVFGPPMGSKVSLYEEIEIHWNVRKNMAENDTFALTLVLDAMAFKKKNSEDWSYTLGTVK